MSLRQQRCILHPNREAVARCPGCGRYFCRECVTEHDGRVLCAACISRLVEAEERPGRASVLMPLMRRMGKAMMLGGCLLLLVCFYLLVAMLLNAVPHRFHDSSAISEQLTDGGQED